MSTFDKVAKSWDEKPSRVALAKAVSDAMEESTDFSNLDLLEIGCGTGLVGLSFSLKCRTLYGIDTSIKMVELFNQKAKTLKIINAKAEVKDLFTDKLPQSDIIFSSMTMHHIENTREALIKMYENLNVGGKILIADLNKEDGTFHTWDAESVYHHGFCRDLFQKILKSVGFKNVSAKTIYEMPKHERTYKIFLAQGEK